MKILLCCGGGFSSSAIATRIQNDINAAGLDHTIEFYPLMKATKQSGEKFDEYDIVLLCPHLRIEIKEFLKSGYNNTPLYLLPPRIYGKMYYEDILMDCEDIIEIFNQTHSNPVHFEGEESLLRVTRDKAFRKCKK